MKRFILISIILCHAGLMLAQTQTPKRTPEGRGYLEFLPSNYATTSNLPCIIFLHGSGERGDGSPAALEKIKIHGTPKFINNGANMCFTVNGKTECFVVLSPQQGTNRAGWTGDVIPFVQFALANYKIDPDRVYVTGLSMGGDGSWDTSYDGKNDPNFLAAIAPVSCKGDYKGAMNTAAKKIFVWAFHGDKDTTVPVSDGQRPINGMNAVGANPAPIFTLVAGGNHSGSTWDKVYSPTHTYYSPNVYEWFLTKKRATSNTAPVALAGADKQITLPVNSVVLTGSGSDADGQVVSYSWKQSSGPNTATLSGASTAALNVNNCVSGQYAFTLTVTDNLGKTATDDAIVTVSNANQAPVANAGADVQLTLPTNSIVLTGSGTDPDGQITSYSWKQSSGPNSATLAGATNPSLNVSNCIQGQYTFSLTVTDNLNITATDDVVVNVISNTNQPPVVNAGYDVKGTLPILTYSLSATASDPDGSIVSYAWTQAWGPLAVINNASSATPTIVVPGIGAYTLRVTVTDNKGFKTYDDVKLTVSKALPVANAGPDKQVILPVSSTTLNGSGTDADGTITGYSWVQTSGPAAVLTNSNAAVATISSLTTSGQYMFMLTVTDNDNQKSIDYVQVMVYKATQSQQSTMRAAEESSTIMSEPEVEPASSFVTSLNQNYPNPFLGSTTIPFTISQDQHVVLKVYDFTGTEVATLLNENLSAGEHTVNFTPTGNQSSIGLFIFRLFADNNVFIVKGSALQY